MKHEEYCDNIRHFLIEYGSGPYTNYRLRRMITHYKICVCSSICQYKFKMDLKAAFRIADTLTEDNWERLWETEKEQAETIEQVAKGLVIEIGYCPDRISWSRFLKIHWQAGRLARRVNALRKKPDKLSAKNNGGSQ